MALFDTIRTVSFATLLLFSLIVLGISANTVSLLRGFTSGFAGFALAVSVITWAFLLPVYLISTLRKGSFLSWVAVELGIVGLLWVLWLASASYTTSASMGLTLNCDLAAGYPELESACRQYQAVQAFSWLNWLILFGYLIMLLVFAIRANGQGHSVWTSDVTDMSSLGAGPGQTGPKHEPTAHSMQQNNVHVPSGAQSQYSQPQSQYTQPQSQYSQPVAHV